MRDPLRGFNQICRMQNFKLGHQYVVLFFELVPENWKEKFEEEYIKLRKDSELRSWVLAHIQENWPFSCIKNPNVLKEILRREFSTEFADEITFFDNLNDTKCPMIRDDLKSVKGLRASYNTTKK